jgi:hypothetical protein
MGMVLPPAPTTSALSAILLETPGVDIGAVNADQQRLLSNMHGQVANFDVKPNLFVKNKGIAKITMTISEQRSGTGGQ